MSKIIQRATFDFLEKLRENNNKEWFTENKTIFKYHEIDVKSFFSEVESGLQKTDNIASHKVYRIYRDVRFSKDKTPYKSRFSGGFARATEALRGGYFLNLEPGNSAVGGGFYGPNPADLKRIRLELEQDDSELRSIMNDSKFKALFGEIEGEELKTAPKGFDVEHPAIDLIRKKQFIFFRNFTDEKVLKPEFFNEIINTFEGIRPFFDYMSSVLTTNLNGESILK